MTPRTFLLCLVPFALSLGGCGQSTPTALPTTGSPEVVRAFFEAVVHQEWPKAYDQLHPDQRTKYTLARFTQLAKSYYQHLGFAPREVHVRSCEEHGAEAIAHVVFTGESGPKQKFHKEAVALQSSVNGWGIVLPPKFGQAK